MHAGLHIPARILNQTFRPLGIPQRFMPVEIRSKPLDDAPIRQRTNRFAKAFSRYQSLTEKEATEHRWLEVAEMAEQLRG